MWKVGPISPRLLFVKKNIQNNNEKIYAENIFQGFGPSGNPVFVFNEYIAEEEYDYLLNIIIIIFIVTLYINIL